MASSADTADTRKLLSALANELCRPKRGGLVCELQAAVVGRNGSGGSGGSRGSGGSANTDGGKVDDWAKLDSDAQLAKIQAVLAKSGAGYDKLRAAELCALLGTTEAEFLAYSDKPVVPAIITTTINAFATTVFRAANDADTGSGSSGSGGASGTSAGTGTGAGTGTSTGDGTDGGTGGSTQPDLFDIRTIWGIYHFTAPESQKDKRFEIDVYSGDISYERGTFAPATITKDATTGKQWVAFGGFKLNFFFHLTDVGVQTISFTGKAASADCKGDREQSTPGEEDPRSAGRDWSSLGFGVAGFIVAIIGILVSIDWKKASSPADPQAARDAKERALKTKIKDLKGQVTDLQVRLEAGLRRDLQATASANSLDVSQQISSMRTSFSTQLNDLSEDDKIDYLDPTKAVEMEDRLVRSAEDQISSDVDSTLGGPLDDTSQKALDYGLDPLGVGALIDEQKDVAKRDLKEKLIDPLPGGEANIAPNVASRMMQEVVAVTAAAQKAAAASDVSTKTGDLSTAAEASRDAADNVAAQQKIVDQYDEGTVERQNEEATLKDLQKDLQEKIDAEKEIDGQRRDAATREVDITNAEAKARRESHEAELKEQAREKEISGR